MRIFIKFLAHATPGYHNDEVPAFVMSEKHFLPKRHYPAFFLPRFLSGPAYLASGNLVARLYNCSLHTPYLNLEDVFTTGICANEKLGLQLSHDSR